MFLNALIEPLLFPLLQHSGFTVGQVGFHREGRGRQVDCVFIVHAYLYLFRFSIFVFRQANPCLPLIFPHLHNEVINYFKMCFISKLFYKLNFQFPAI